MLKKIAYLLFAAVIAFCVAAAMQPDEFRVSRDITINAKAAKIFPLVNDHHQWEQWSPWAKIDPNATFAYEGAKAGVGAIAKWDGNMEVGKGTSTIVESKHNELVKFQLDFEKPMKGTSTAEITLKEEGGKTHVTWLMYGPNSFLGKAMGLIMNCEKMVGEQFEKGLGNLKSIAEK